MAISISNIHDCLLSLFKKHLISCKYHDNISQKACKHHHVMRNKKMIMIINII